MTWPDAGPCKPAWMPMWCLRSMNNDIRRSGLSRVIGQLKSHGVESASWATIPPIMHDATNEIRRSEIHVMNHDPTDFARSDG